MDVTCYEHNFIKLEDLPTSWRSEKNIAALEQFLQLSWDQRSVLYLDQETTKKQLFLDFDHRAGVKTRNYIGTIVYNGERLDIFPKIYRSLGNEPKMEDLINDLTIWLHYCNGGSYPFINMPSTFDNVNNTFEIFVAVYLQYVEEALKKQAFMSYEDIIETGSAVKGKIDFINYTLKKLSSGQKHLMDYTYSSFNFDNKVNRIIKATCLMINRITISQKSKNIIRKIMSQLEDVAEIVCSPGDCDKVQIAGVKSSYKVIMQMSKMFLMNKTASGMQGQLDAFCFLFPAELLFEGFVGGFIKETLKDYASVRLQSKSHYLAEAFHNNESCGSVFQIKEDIIIDTDDFSIVIDTKYKAIMPLSNIATYKKLDVEDADMKQMIVYALENDAMEVYLIYPLSRNEEPDNDEVYYKVLTNYNGESCEMKVYILRVPFTFNENSLGRMEIMRKKVRKILVDNINLIDDM
jgi:5-methylcytosine-specific restriction enzyme subunit McrC